MLYFVCACVHTSAYSSYVHVCSQWVHYSHREGNVRLISEDYSNVCAVLFSHGYQWYPSCSSHNCKPISQFSPTQTHIWCLLVGISHNIRTVFSMAFSKHMYEWLFPSCSFIFTFSSLLAFRLLPLLFLFSLGMNFAALYFWSLFLHFSFLFPNLSPFSFLSFFPTSKVGGNLCLPLKSLS